MTVSPPAVGDPGRRSGEKKPREKNELFFDVENVVRYRGTQSLPNLPTLPLPLPLR